MPGEFEQLLGSADAVGDVADREDDDPAVIIYTSGTTGTPKGATLTHANIHAGAKVGGELVDATPEKVALATLPLFHVFGMSVMMNVTIAAHALLTLVPRFEPAKVLEVIQRDRVTTFGGVPTMYTALLHHPEPASGRRLRLCELCVSGGAALPVEVLHGFDERLRLQGAGGLRPVGDLRDGDVQPARSRAQAGLDRHPDRWHRGPARRR